MRAIGSFGDICAFVALAMTSLILSAHAVEVPPVISSHMVLQRDVPVPIWGTAKAGEKVTVTFRDKQKTVETDKDGKWMVRLDKLDVGKPAVMTIAGSNTLTLEDVVVGEVWLASGQSNMAISTPSFTANDPLLADYVTKTYPDIRFAPRQRSWLNATPAKAGEFSALGMSFAVPLQKELGVPVGIIQAAASSSPSGAWLTPEMFNADRDCRELVASAAASDAEKARYQTALAKYTSDLAAWEKTTADLKAAAATNPTTAPAKTPQKPQPPLKVGDYLVSSFGEFGQCHENAIKPLAPFAIRGVLWDQGESGTAVEGVDQCTLMGALIAGWRKEWNQGDWPFVFMQKPSGAGCAWDYKDPLARKADPFEQQPASYPDHPVNGAEYYIQMLKYPNTAMVTTSDLGSGNHPENKSGYGARAARVVMGAVYGGKAEYYGPTYATFKVDGDRVTVSFTHVGAGLAFANGQKLQGFAVAGDNKRYYWADAAINGDQVILTCQQVPHPVAVRYAWSWTWHWANLFNKDGLPALPFRTDSW